MDLRWIAVITVALSATLVRPVLAEPAKELPWEGRYHAPKGCPTREYLESSVRARLVPAREDAGQRGPLRFSVSISAAVDGMVAEVRFEVPGDVPVTRRVVAPDCRQVVEGVALILALAIDAQPPRPPSEAPRRPAPSQAPPPAEHPPQKRVATGFQASVAGGVAPGASWGGGVASRLSLGARGPALRPSVSVYDSFWVRSAGAKVRFQQVLGRLALCADRWLPGEHVQLDPCLGGEAGVTRARGLEDGDRLVRAKHTSEPWLAMTLALWLRASSEGAFFELGPDLRVPLLRHRYVLENPDAAVHRTPRASLGFAFGAGLRF